MLKGRIAGLVCALLIGACTPTITVKGSGGELRLNGTPERIVSLSASHTEMLYAVGAGGLVVGTDLTSDYPAEAMSTVKVDAFNFDVEEIAALEPDLVILAFDFAGEVDALGSIGIPALLLGPATSLEEAYRQVEVIGAVTGRPAEGRAIAAEMRSQIGALLENADPFESRSVYHEVDSTLFSATSATLIGDIYNQLGLRNIADEAIDEFGSGYPQLSAEYILSEAPELIFLADADFGESRETIMDRPGWDSLSATHIWGLDGALAGRWGPRTVDLVRSIYDAVNSQP